MGISIERLMNDIERYAACGLDSNGGMTRLCLSDTDLKARQLFIEDLTNLGVEVTVDGAANIWGRLKGNGNKTGSIVVGSHLDTVPNGGKYDGALGVLVAKEVLQVIKQRGIELDHDLEVVSFTGEEANDFNVSTLGSRGFTGKLTPDQVQDVTDSKGVRLEDALEKAGGKFELFENMKQMRQEKKAFLELHIEQGKRLEEKDIPIAVVDGIVGIYRDKVTVEGEANHSGTTFMNHRKDALTTASELILTVENLLREQTNDLVGTVGKLDVFPNATNIIPGQVEFILEVRGKSDKLIADMVREIKTEWGKIVEERKLDVKYQNILNQKAVTFNAEMVEVIEEAIQNASSETSYLTLASMAGHDASHMADIAKTAMIFVKSIGGKSHCPEEYSRPEDIEICGNAMLEALIRMDKQLS
jgi:hydantoinase/carbamoylase family amidase